MQPFFVIASVWIIWVAVWALSALWTNPVRKQMPRHAERPYRMLSVAGAILIAWGSHGAMPLTGTAGWAMAALAVAGVGFAFWARWHLGRYWSATVARREGHRLIESGPYRIVRHPIYTGVIAALTATTIAMGRPLAVAGAGLLMTSFAVKARLEERFLREEFGPAYAAYAARVPMLIPFWPRTG